MDIRFAVSGADLASLVNVSFDEDSQLEIANMAARRLAAVANRANGMSHRAARKAAMNAKATPAQQAIVGSQLMSGATIEQAVRAVIATAYPVQS